MEIILEAVRKNAGFTQKEWARALHVTTMTVVNWENGKTEPTLSQLQKMRELSGISIDCMSSGMGQRMEMNNEGKKGTGVLG